MTCPQYQPVPPKKGCGWLASVAGALMLAVLMAVLTLLANTYEKKHGTSCASNLKGIGLAARAYAMDHDDQFPLELQALRDLGYIKDPDAFLCPASSTRPGTGSAFVTSYVYLGAGLKQGPGGDEIPIAMDPRNHDRTIKILFKDGHIYWFDLPRKMTSCVEVLHHLLPDLDQSPEGRLVLENAQKADKGL